MERAEDLAVRFERIHGELTSAVEACSDADWQTASPPEGWSVGVVVHHVASGQAQITGLTQLIANGGDLPSIGWEAIHQGNAEHAQQFANCTKEETLDLLRQDGPAAAGALRGLSDQKLERTALMPVMGEDPISAGQFAEMVMLGHMETHLASIRGALGQSG